MKEKSYLQLVDLIQKLTEINDLLIKKYGNILINPSDWSYKIKLDENKK